VLAMGEMVAAQMNETEQESEAAECEFSGRNAI
jgi:hypothetical protein